MQIKLFVMLSLLISVNTYADVTSIPQHTVAEKPSVVRYTCAQGCKVWCKSPGDKDPMKMDKGFVSTITLTHFPGGSKSMFLKGKAVARMIEMQASGPFCWVDNITNFKHGWLGIKNDKSKGK